MDLKEISSQIKIPLVSVKLGDMVSVAGGHAVLQTTRARSSTPTAETTSCWKTSSGNVAVNSTVS